MTWFVWALPIAHTPDQIEGHLSGTISAPQLLILIQGACAQRHLG
jgi:hypothetical protein